MQDGVRGGGEGSDETGSVKDDDEDRDSEAVLSLEPWYKDVVIFCVRYLGFTSTEQVDRLTLPEFEMLKEGALMREADREYYAHLQAYATMQARAKKQVGKSKYDYVYKTFKKFYDRDERIEEILGKRAREKKKENDKLAAYKKHLKEKEKRKRKRKE